MAQVKTPSLDHLFRRQPSQPVTPIKSIRFKRALSDSLIAHEGDLRRLTVRNNKPGDSMLATFFAAVDRLCYRPEITKERIETNLIGRQVIGNPPSILTNWRFDTPGRITTQITIVQSDYSGDTVTIVIDMKSEAGPRAFFPRKMVGKLRLHYEWVAGWTLVRIENLDFKEQ